MNAIEFRLPVSCLRPWASGQVVVSVVVIVIEDLTQGSHPEVNLQCEMFICFSRLKKKSGLDQDFLRIALKQFLK